MIKATFKNDNFIIKISLKQFSSLWDDSYESFGEYNINKYKDILGISSSIIDLNSFVAEQILSILNEDGEEDDGANNEFFEDYDAFNCRIDQIIDDYIFITGKMKSF